MANYKGAQRDFYNLQRSLKARIAGFEKAGIRVPAELSPASSSRIAKILSTTPGKASKWLMNQADTVRQQMENNPARFSARAWKTERAKIIKHLSAPPKIKGGVNVGGLGYEYINEENADIFFDFMEYVRTKFENMRFDSDIYAAAANEMLGQAQRRGVSAEDLKANFERYAEQALRITTSNKTLSNYQQNFNALSRRLGL